MGKVSPSVFFVLGTNVKTWGLYSPITALMLVSDRYLQIAEETRNNS